MTVRRRRGGLTAAVVSAMRERVAVASSEEEQRRAATIGKATEVAAVELLRSGIEPVEMVAPLTVAAEVSAKVVAANAGLDPADARLVEDVKRYLLFGWREMATGLDPEHFAVWRAANPPGR